MPVQYQFKCPNCNNIFTVDSRDTAPFCQTCQRSTKRTWSFTTSMGMKEHFNNSVGQYVRNSREFNDELKRKSESESLRTGMDVDYQPIDPSDMRDPSAHGVTEEGLEETYRASYDS